MEAKDADSRRQVARVKATSSMARQGPPARQLLEISPRKLRVHSAGRWVRLDRMKVDKAILVDESELTLSSNALLAHWLTVTELDFSQLLERITPGQRQVLCAYVREPNDRSVARELDISESTVRNHLTVIEATLNAASRGHLIAMCMAALIRESITAGQID